MTPAEARDADRTLRGLRATALLAYSIAIVIAGVSDKPAAPYFLVALMLGAVAVAVWTTGRIRSILEPHRDRATGDLPFPRARLWRR